MDRTVKLSNLGLALLIGTIGGALFQALHLPLAWMLGPMSFNIVAALRGLPVAIPLRLRSAAQAVLGIFLGSSFSPEILSRAKEWPWSLIAITAFVVVSTVLVALYYRRVAGFDRVTALYSATPGAMTAMIFMGAEAGGDERRIALAQALRITLVVLLIPPLVLAVQPAVLVQAQQNVPLSGFNGVELLLLAAGSALGIMLARLARLPAAEIIGSMFVSAGLYLGDFVHLALPQPVLQATLCILGSAVGARFAGVPIRQLINAGRYALGAVFLALSLAALFAAAISAFLDVEYLAALLSLIPGGVAEMCLIAVAFHIDPAFVAFNHLARLLILMAVAPLVIRRLRPRQEKL